MHSDDEAEKLETFVAQVQQAAAQQRQAYPDSLRPARPFASLAGVYQQLLAASQQAGWTPLPGRRAPAYSPAEDEVAAWCASVALKNDYRSRTDQQGYVGRIFELSAATSMGEAAAETSRAAGDMRWQCWRGWWQAASLPQRRQQQPLAQHCSKLFGAL